jgi:N-acetylglucosaminyldiphosphoundecaprenol N-acetyl-beta-D-mannosaminyltransferase
MGPANGIERVDVLGVHVSAINMPMALDEISRWIEDGKRHYVCITGVHGVMESQQDERLRSIHNRSGLTTPDGMPMVWAGRRAGADHMERVYGPDLMLEVCRLSVERGWRHYLYGGKEGVASMLSDRLCQRFPGLEVVGEHTPPFRALTAEESDEIVAEINASGAHIVWIGLSTPKQELWMDRFSQRLEANALIGVGAAFDIHAGLVSQAPVWMQRNGLEWLYRLVREPRRLWRRYLGNNPRFAWAIWQRPPQMVPAESTTDSE